MPNLSIADRPRLRALPMYATHASIDDDNIDVNEIPSAAYHTLTVPLKHCKTLIAISFDDSGARYQQQTKLFPC
jgi:hypothetical protein